MLHSFSITISSSHHLPPDVFRHATDRSRPVAQPGARLGPSAGAGAPRRALLGRPGSILQPGPWRPRSGPRSVEGGGKRMKEVGKDPKWCGRLFGWRGRCSGWNMEDVGWNFADVSDKIWLKLGYFTPSNRKRHRSCLITLEDKIASYFNYLTRSSSFAPSSDSQPKNAGAARFLLKAVGNGR